MPQRYRVMVMPEASVDLANAFEYVHRESPQNAAGLLQQLFDAIDSLEQLPHRYKVHQSTRDPNRIIRSMPVPQFVIYYRVLERESVVEVLTVRHGARRPPRRFRR